MSVPAVVPMPGVLVIFFCVWPGSVLTKLHQVYCVPCLKPSVMPPTRARFHCPCPDWVQQHMIPLCSIYCPSTFGAHPLTIWCPGSKVRRARWLLWERQHFEIQTTATWKSEPYGPPQGSGNAIHFLNIDSCLHKKESSPGAIFWKDRSFIFPQVPYLSWCFCTSVTLSRTLRSCTLLIH